MEEEMAGSASDPNGLFAELGLDPEAPEQVAAREDDIDFTRLVTMLAKTRERLGVSQSELADRLGTKQSAISRLERGLSDARYSTLQSYARALGLRLRTGAVTRDAWSRPTKVRLGSSESSTGLVTLRGVRRHAG